MDGKPIGFNEFNQRIDLDMALDAPLWASEGLQLDSLGHRTTSHKQGHTEPYRNDYE